VLALARRTGHSALVTLRRFWFEFEGGEGLPFGCGVTAEDADAALDLVAEAYCDGRRPIVRTRVDDVDVGQLADRLAPMVRPLRLGVPTIRGIWYPNLTGP
jgi:hypothetical protein